MKMNPERARKLNEGSRIPDPEEERATLVLRLRRSRQKARQAAVAEVLALMRGLDAEPASGGPLSEAGGVAWVSIPVRNWSVALGRLHGLGYSGVVEGVRRLNPVGRSMHPD